MFIKAQEEENVSSEIVITATKTETKIRDVSGVLEVISADDAKKVNVINVSDLFKTMAGVDLQGGGLPGSEVRLNFRGLTPGYQSKRVLVLVDGRRLNDQYQGNPEMALIPADSIERIEVLKGPASALYGSNAMGGIINIVTKRGTETPVTIIRGAGGSHNTSHYRVSHGSKKGNVDDFVSASHIRTDGYLNNSDGTDRDWESWNVDGNVGIILSDKSEIRIFAGDYEGEGTDENSERDAHRDYAAARYTLEFPAGSHDGKLELMLYRNGERQEYEWKYPGEGIYDQYTVGGEIQCSMWMSDRDLITAGVDGRREDVDIDEVQNDIDEHTSIVSFYLQDEMYLGEIFKITAGARYDDSDDYDSELSPRLGVLMRISPDCELFASANRAHREPALSDRYVKTVYNGMQFEGNPDLDPETLKAYEAGMRCRFADRLETEVSTFYNDMDDSFDFMLDTTTTNVFRIRNATRIETYGAEFSSKLKITDTISAFLNYTFTDGEYDEFLAMPGVEGNELAYLAKHKAGIGVNYATEKGWSHSFSLRYIDSRFGDAQNTDDQKMDDYIVGDFHSRVPLYKGVTLTLDVNNVFDEEYNEFPAYEQPDRTVMIGIEAEV